jgi:rhodanese-related sulfurtransferase
VALQLRKHGIRPVRPLLGGFFEWKRLGFPLTGTPVNDAEATELSSRTA